MLIKYNRTFFKGYTVYLYCFFSYYDLEENKNERDLGLIFNKGPIAQNTRPLNIETKKYKIIN